MRKAVRLDKTNHRFRLFFLREGAEKSVEVREVGDVDFQEVEKRLEQGEAIIITPETSNGFDVNRVSYREMRAVSRGYAEDPRYFTHE